MLNLVRSVTMINAQLFSKLAVLPSSLKAEVADFVDFLTYKSKKQTVKQKRIAGKAESLVFLREDFDDVIPGIEDYKE